MARGSRAELHDLPAALLASYAVDPPRSGGRSVTSPHSGDRLAFPCAAFGEGAGMGRAHVSPA
ncbi:hypothetical protein [Streptosporangium amethystogenes]|uniref:hypothetical protein n=1 Tax=Streptosporangium amethystogenes TaxID=2002 RepID=UPI0004C8197A|nr:hypothetical protein [Streptosporangium amethystogenes]